MKKMGMLHLERREVCEQLIDFRVNGALGVL